MINSNLFKLYAPSFEYVRDFMAGSSIGRKMDVWDFFRVWYHHFFTIATNLFEYRGIDDDLQKQIEKRLFFYGVCGVIEKDGDLIAVDANGNGENIYSEPTHFTFSFGNGDADRYEFSREINIDGVYARNAFDYFPSFFEVEKMAFTLAHIDTSIMCESINMRSTDIYKAGNDKCAESARTFRNALYVGKLDVITDKTQELEIERQTRTTTHMKDLLDAKERTLKEYYETFGIRKQGEKRERMITDEVQANEHLLHFNLKDMLNCRTEMCKNIKNVFGVECSVVSHVDIDEDGKQENSKEMRGDTNDNE